MPHGVKPAGETPAQSELPRRRGGPLSPAVQAAGSASSLGTPGAGSLHLNIAESASDASTVGYDDQHAVQEQLEAEPRDGARTAALMERHPRNPSDNYSVDAEMKNDVDAQGVAPAGVSASACAAAPARDGDDSDIS